MLKGLINVINQKTENKWFIMKTEIIKSQNKILTPTRYKKISG